MIIRRAIYIGYNEMNEHDDFNILSLLRYTFGLVIEKTFTTAMPILDKFDDVTLVIVSLKSVPANERAMVLGLKQRLRAPEITACYLDDTFTLNEMPHIVPGRLYMLPYDASLFKKFVKQLSECEDPNDQSTGSLRDLAKLYKKL